jgi:hypothetical protein
LIATGSMVSSTSMDEVCISSFLTDSLMVAGTKLDPVTLKAMLLVFDRSAGGLLLEPSLDDLPARNPFVLFCVWGVVVYSLAASCSVITLGNI